MNGHLRHPGDHARRLDIQQIHHSRREINRVAELVADLSRRSELRRPMNNQRISHSAAVSVLFVPLEWRIPRLCPSPR
jgi:hypothetical protein